MKTLDWNQRQQVRYCVENWARDANIAAAIKRISGRIQPGKRRAEPIAVVGFGPSLADTWEKIKEFQFVISCSGSHKFLVEHDIVPTFHVDVDPRPHKALLIGPPQKETTYLIASACHKAVFDHLDGFNVLLWHIFDATDAGIHALPPGEWAITGGCDAGLRAMTVAGFLGFRDLHIFGMDGCGRPEGGSHAASHPNAVKKYASCEYKGVTYQTTPALLEAARQVWHELDQMPAVRATFYGEGLIQHMAQHYTAKSVAEPDKFENVVGFVKPELISAEYRALNAQLHRENIAYGVGGEKHADTVLKLCKTLKTKDVLDYGCQPVDAKVLTPTGWQRIGDIHIGDRVIGANGQPINVIDTHSPGVVPVYRVNFSDGASLVVDENHLWAVRTSNHQKRQQPFVVKSTKELMAEDLRWNSANWPYRPLKWRIPMVAPVEFGGNDELPLDPYLLGILLGDGSLSVSCVEFTSATIGLPEAVTATLPSGLELNSWKKTGSLASGYRIVRTNRMEQWGKHSSNAVKNAVRTLGLDGCRAWEKFVPPQYLLTTAKNRVALLQGLLDTDGEVRSKHTSYCTTSQQLAENVVFLAQSLGCNTSVSIKEAPHYQYGIGKPAFVVHIKPAPQQPLARVKSWEERKQYHANRLIESIEPAGVAEVVGLSVDAKDELYVTEHFIVTHNCGKSRLARALPFHIQEYDPAIPGKEESPKPADIVIASDVLEHIEPDKLTFVLGDLRRCVKQVGYFVISTVAAQKTLADGRNTHLLIKNKKWWTARLKQFFTIGKVIESGSELHVVAAPKTRTLKKQHDTL